MDTWITPHEQDGDVLCLFCVLFFFNVLKMVTIHSYCTGFSWNAVYVFYELEIFTPPLISTGVRRY